MDLFTRSRFHIALALAIAGACWFAYSLTWLGCP
jgi:hypothetical protein